MFESRGTDESCMKERRNNNRLLCAELVELIYRDIAGRDCRRVVNLDDMSRAGACVQLEVAIPEGTRVKLRYPGGELSGDVRHCGFRERSYFLGIAFNQDCQWSPGYLPRHLLDPRELVENAMNRVLP